MQPDTPNAIVNGMDRELTPAEEPDHGSDDRDPELPWIERHVGRRSGQWVIAGSRVTVGDVEGYTAAGMAPAEIAENLGVPLAGVEAARAFAARQRLAAEGPAQITRAREDAPACDRCGAIAWTVVAGVAAPWRCSFCGREAPDELDKAIDRHELGSGEAGVVDHWTRTDGEAEADG